MGQTLPTAKLPRDIDTQFVRGPDLKDVEKDDIAGRYDDKRQRRQRRMQRRRRRDQRPAPRLPSFDQRTALVPIAHPLRQHCWHKSIAPRWCRSCVVDAD